MKRFMLLAVVVALVGSACGGSDADSQDPDRLIAIRASTDLAVGDSRLVFAVNEIDGTRRGSPDETVSVVATPLDEPSRSLSTVAAFTWILPGTIGLYVADLPFDMPGIWQVDFTVSTGEPTDAFLVDVQAEPKTVAIGDPAPEVATPTLADTAIEDLTTDSDPLEALYQISLDEALDNGRKTVVLFATPAFCVSAACGPLLEQTKAMVSLTDAVDFIHVEVYEGFNEPGFTPTGDRLAAAVRAFGLPSEPWIFVMDEQGTVIARLEGVLVEGELESLLGL